VHPLQNSGSKQAREPKEMNAISLQTKEVKITSIKAFGI
jgi:hypothetical protein